MVVCCLYQVREPFQSKDKDKEKTEGSPYLPELRACEEKAKQLGLGRWSKVLNFSIDSN
jgi:endonuclease YncB( thermonuclease family)